MSCWNARSALNALILATALPAVSFAGEAPEAYAARVEDLLKRSPEIARSGDLARQHAHSKKLITIRDRGTAQFGHALDLPYGQCGVLGIEAWSVWDRLLTLKGQARSLAAAGDAYRQYQERLTGCKDQIRATR